MAISGKVGAVYVQTADAAATFTDQALTNSGDGLTWYITDRDKAYWDKNTAVTVETSPDGVTWSTAPAHTIQYAGGYVVFEASQAGKQVRASGKNFTVSQAGGFFDWSADMQTDIVESTTFINSGWKSFEPTILGFTGSAEAYWGDETFFNKLGQEVIVVLYVDSGTSKKRYEGYCIINSNGIQVAVSELIQESIGFEGDGPLYYREG